MSHVNNIFNIKINSIEHNSSVNFGHAIHKGNTAHEKSVGCVSVDGDANPIRAVSNNYVNQPI